MAGNRCLARANSLPLWLLLLLATITTLIPATWAAPSSGTRWIEYTGNDGTVYLKDGRRPSLYTQTFGDCQGDSLINVTRFDAAYYRDNMTVQFHVGGSSALTNESLMLYIGVYAYGEARFNLTFNPCSANIDSMCPLNSSVPIEANGIIPVSPSDVANIPSIALSIPDFEGQAILRIFANSTQSQISCYSAVITNGASFSHPAAVGTVLGVFALVALVSSIAVAIYGHSVPDTRKHYAHSLSVMLVFAVYQHIFYTGVLSMNWPSVLVAFWSNYAWSAGMIFTSGMQDSINKFIGTNRGNISLVGSVQSGENVANLGGGFQASQIYRRSSDLFFSPYEGSGTTLRPRALEHALSRRDLVNSSSGFSWYGDPVRTGLPLPGNYSGFAGTLAELEIPASNAFLTGLIWFLVLTLIVASLIVGLKLVIELLSNLKLVKSDRLTFFRQHWIKFTVAAVLRTCFLAFFMIMVLTLFQFTLGGPTRLIAIAGLVFGLFFVGMFGLVAYALFSRLRHEKFVKPGDQVEVRRSDLSLLTPRGSSNGESEEKQATEQPQVVKVSWWQMHFTDVDSEKPHPHDDDSYTTKFGWLSSRFRRSKWWFFAFWLVYEFIRACFYGAAAGHALAQVFGLLAWEIVAFIAIIILKPFESNRLNLLIVYFLGFSKVATVALSSAFDEKFGLSRILTTVIGIIIIVIQGILTICVMIAVVLGAISSYMSITRYRDTIKPKSWHPHREKYFKHIDQKATDQPPPPPPPPPRPETPKEPYFAVTSVRREPKIEDEDPLYADMERQLSADEPAGGAPSSTRSMRRSSSNLPYGGPRLRPSWSTLDLQAYDSASAQPCLGSETSPEEARRMAHRRRAASLRGPPSRPGVVPQRSKSKSETKEEHKKDARQAYSPHNSPDQLKSSLTKEDIQDLFSGAPHFMLEKGRRGRYFPQAFFPWNNELDITDLQDCVHSKHATFSLATLHAHLPGSGPRPGLLLSELEPPSTTQPRKRPTFDMAIYERPNMIGLTAVEAGTIAMRTFLERPVRDGLNHTTVHEHGKDVDLSNASSSTLAKMSSTEVLRSLLHDEGEASIGKQGPKRDRNELMKGGPKAWKTVGIRNITLETLADRFVHLSKVRDDLVANGWQFTMLNIMSEAEWGDYLFSELLYPPSDILDGKGTKNDLKVQIEALVKVLTTPGVWIDLSLPKERWLFLERLYTTRAEDQSRTDQYGISPSQQRHWNLTQLLLSIELVIRLDAALRLGIASHEIHITPKEIHHFNRLRNLKVDWDLVVARRFAGLTYAKKIPSSLTIQRTQSSSQSSSQGRHGFLDIFKRSHSSDEVKVPYDIGIFPRELKSMAEGLVVFGTHIRWPTIEAVKASLKRKLAVPLEQQEEILALGIEPPQGECIPAYDGATAVVELRPASETTIGGPVSRGWLGGFIIPGYSTPGLLMCALLENDPEGQPIAALGNKAWTRSGFVWRERSWWSKANIVGRVMAPFEGTTEAVGWVALPEPVTPVDSDTGETFGDGWLLVRAIEPRKLREGHRIYDGEAVGKESSPLGLGHGKVLSSEFSMVTDDVLDKLPKVDVEDMKLVLEALQQFDRSGQSGEGSEGGKMIHRAAVSAHVSFSGADKSSKSFSIPLTYQISFW
ncbi:hypothetical protein DV738_g3810, partial [Chaetothyriales sp. CBS 135597]